MDGNAGYPLHSSLQLLGQLLFGQVIHLHLSLGLEGEREVPLTDPCSQSVGGCGYRHKEERSGWMELDPLNVTLYLLEWLLQGGGVRGEGEEMGHTSHTSPTDLRASLGELMYQNYTATLYRGHTP